MIIRKLFSLKKFPLLERPFYKIASLVRSLFWHFIFVTNKSILMQLMESTMPSIKPKQKLIFWDFIAKARLCFGVFIKDKEGFEESVLAFWVAQKFWKSGVSWSFIPIQYTLILHGAPFRFVKCRNCMIWTVKP